MATGRWSLHQAWLLTGILMLLLTDLIYTSSAAPDVEQSNPLQVESSVPPHVGLSDPLDNMSTMTPELDKELNKDEENSTEIYEKTYNLFEENQSGTEKLNTRQLVLGKERVGTDDKDTAANSIFTKNVAFEPCNKTTPFMYSCENPVGFAMNTPDAIGDITFSFNIGVTGVVTMVWFNKTDIVGMKKDKCFMTIGKTTFTSATNLRNTTTIYITTEDTITITNEIDECNITVYYAAINPVPVTIMIPPHQTEGSLQFPEQLSDPLGYPPQQRLQWTFNYSENVIIELNIVKLDLGYGRADLHWVDTYNNKTDNDFLLIGLGTEIMEWDDILLFGWTDEARGVRINYPSAHVVFYGGYHEQYATGFRMEYTAVPVLNPVTTTALPTTVPPVRDPLPSTWAPLDDARSNTEDTINTTTFLLAMSVMATDYINKTNLNVEDPPTVETSQVVIHQIKTCHPDMCKPNCVDFNFSIWKLNSNGDAWAFNTTVLDTMIRRDDLQQHWMIIDTSCKFCEESVMLNWYLVGGVAAGTVLVAVVVSLVAWKAKKISAIQKSKQICEEDNKLQEIEKRRRSSGDVSIIGGAKGGTKLSLPFGRGKRSVASSVDSDGQETYDMADFTENDPNFGFDDFGLGAGPRHHYTNAAYDHDSPTQRSSRYQQLQDYGEEEISTTFRPPLPSLKRNPMLKSSLKIKKDDRAADEEITDYEDATSSTKKNVTKTVSILQEGDEEESDDSDGDGAVTFPADISKRRIQIVAEVHSDSTGV